MGRDRLDRAPATPGAGTGPGQPRCRGCRRRRPYRRVGGPRVAAAGGGGQGRVVALTAAGVVLVAAIVTGAVAARHERRGPAKPAVRADRQRPRRGTTADPRERRRRPRRPTDDSALLTDQLNGITLPLPDGWEKSDSTVDRGHDHDDHGRDLRLPRRRRLCRHGTVISRTVTATDENSPEALAKEDIKDAADDAYDRTPRQPHPFGGIASHAVLKSRAGRGRRPRRATSCAGASRPGGARRLRPVAGLPLHASAPRRWSSSGTPSTRARTGRRSPTWTGSPRASARSATRHGRRRRQQHRPAP